LCTTGKAGLDTTLLAGTGFSSFLPSFLPPSLPLFVELCASAGAGTALEISSCYFLVFSFQILFLYFGFNRKSQSVFCQKSWWDLAAAVLAYLETDSAVQLQEQQSCFAAQFSRACRVTDSRRKELDQQLQSCRWFAFLSTE
jgi:hypothetical protein